MIGSLKNILIFQFILVAFLPLVTFFATFALLSSQFEKDISDRNYQLALSISREADAFMSGTLNALNLSVVEHSLNRRYGSRRIFSHLNAILKEQTFLDDIVVFSPDFTIKQIIPYEKNLIGINLSKANYFKNSLPSNFFASDIFLSYKTGMPTISITKKMRNGYLTGNLNLSAFREMILKVNVGKEGYVFILDDNGNVISHHEEKFVLQRAQLKNMPLVEWALKGNSGPHTFFFNRGMELGSIARMDSTGWIVGVVQPASEAFSSINWARLVILTGILCSILIVIVISLKFIPKSIRPLIKFTNHIRDVSMGDYDLTFDTGATSFREIDDLSGSFSNMVNSIKEREKELKKSEDRFRALFNNAAVGISVVDTEGSFIQVNFRWTTMTGYNMEEILSLNVSDITHIDDLDKSLSMFKKVEAGEIDFYRLENRYIRKDGNYIWVDLSVTPIYNLQGNLDAYMGIIIDITERKDSEQKIRLLNEELESRVAERTHELRESLENLQTAQRHIVQTEKMATLGNLVAGVAHEINTPLGIGITASSFLKDQTDLFVQKVQEGISTEKVVHEYLAMLQESSDMILNNLQRAGDLINSFKQVAVEQTRDALHRFYIKEYIHDIINSLYPKIRRLAHSIIINAPDDLEMQSYPGAISQILTNFIMNSMKHGFPDESTGTLNIHISSDGDHVYLSYSDDGIGASQEIVDHIFEPFFTTARANGGTGLGMHIVYNLVVHKLKGKIECFSSPGKGIAFNITIPRVIEIEDEKVEANS